ncbi:MAG: carboxymuconolactone decarboxylase family protein [Streptosporangiaceae bacterium]
MSRLAYLRYDDLDPAGRQVWDEIIGSRGATVIDDQETLIGPFNAYVTAPEVGRHLSALGQAVRFGAVLPPRLSELAIITVAARWRAEFEWWAHARTAAEHGIPAAVIDAIAAGGEPVFAAPDERIVHAAARQLAATGRLEPEAFEAGRALLGDGGMVHLVALCGYYTTVSFLLNAFEVPLPAGAEPAWPAESEAG